MSTLWRISRLASGALFAPKYLENKLKFYPNIREVVTFGHERDFVTAMINIDMEAVGNWAERRNIPYSSYQELAARPEVLDIVEGHVSEFNESLATDPQFAGSQIHRFIVLHKMLDADDGELTRTIACPNCPKRQCGDCIPDAQSAVHPPISLPRRATTAGTLRQFVPTPAPFGRSPPRSRST